MERLTVRTMVQRVKLKAARTVILKAARTTLQTAARTAACLTQEHCRRMRPWEPLKKRALLRMKRQTYRKETVGLIHIKSLQRIMATQQMTEIQKNRVRRKKHQIRVRISRRTVLYR